MISFLLVNNPVYAVESIYYISSPYPNLYFRYTVDDENCYFRIQRDNRREWNTWDFEKDNWGLCYEEFLTNVRKQYSDFEPIFMSTNIESENDDGVPIGAIRSISSLFRLMLWWTILHVFYTMIPGFKL